jgi:hypothetical protein
MRTAASVAPHLLCRALLLQSRLEGLVLLLQLAQAGLMAGLLLPQLRLKLLDAGCCRCQRCRLCWARLGRCQQRSDR